MLSAYHSFCTAILWFHLGAIRMWQLLAGRVIQRRQRLFVMTWSDHMHYITKGRKTDIAVKKEPEGVGAMGWYY